MTNLTRLASICFFLAACGDSGGSGDGGTGNGDGGPTGDGGSQISGPTAKGVYPEVVARARQIQPDMRLIRIGGNKLMEGGREIDPELAQSYWSFIFVSPSTGTQVDYIYSQGTVTMGGMSMVNPEGQRYIDGARPLAAGNMCGDATCAPTDLCCTETPDGQVTTTCQPAGDPCDGAWMDSDLAIDKLVEAGFGELGDAELREDYWTMSATLEMYGGADPTFQMAPEPIWRIAKAYDDPPLGDPEGEEWWVTHWEAQMGYVVCNPMFECFVTP